MDLLDGIPKHVLGYPVKTRIQIIFHYLIPACLELQAYIIQTVADTAVTIQHFRDHHPLYGWLTLLFLCLPAIVCFFSIMISSWQWPEVEKSCCSTKNVQFFLKQLFNFLLFPIGALNRFSRRIFWSTESLFHNKDTRERQHSVMKAAETSPFELYHFVQAYIQAAPQAILQLYILLKGDIFRNYETTNVQVLSVIFSLINLSVITMSYQRFESQKIVGRYYPWATPQQLQHWRSTKFHHIRNYMDEVKQSHRRGLNSIKSFPENDKILEKFHSQIMESENFASISPSTANAADAITGNKKIPKDEIYLKNFKRIVNKRRRKEPETGCSTHEYHEEDSKDKDKEILASKHTDDDLVYMNVTDDEKLNSCQEQHHQQQQQKQQQQQQLKDMKIKDLSDELDAKMLQEMKKRPEKQENLDAIEVVEEISLYSTPLQEQTKIRNVENINFDSVPDIPAPPPPPSTPHSHYTNKVSVFDVKQQQQCINISDSNGINDGKQRHSLNAFERLSTLKDMLILNAEFSIIEYVPRPPRILVKHALNAEEWKIEMKNNQSSAQNENIHQHHQHMKMSVLRRDYGNDSHDVNKKVFSDYGTADNAKKDSSGADDVDINDEKQISSRHHDQIDFLLPTKKRMYKGIEQDDFVGKSVSFVGWILFIFMRIISLSVFSVFYPWELMYVVIAHYTLMLLCLIYETKFHEKIHRIIFYLFLAYIYIFVIIEFRIQFKRIRLWCIGYFTLVIMENFIVTFLWYFGAEFESWIFEYLFQAIIVSGIFNIACMLVYFHILKPNDKILIET